MMYCVHGMSREHQVSVGGTLCIGPFRWLMTKPEANGLADYYRLVERLVGGS